ncbi:uncharacterized protein FIBRA_08479 [Fibroporia radiculosa]|uniref:Uncharacterized protein n=1 Tax=Fibroporia radiculosa TaxID=599839 RepID=J4GHI2_9APHY|nr:uncharacterized protein FIBRA_08479 [Fibroporia radiculosa]CCM06233.1 predicted protein [Fibroporia radiculosa]
MSHLPPKPDFGPKSPGRYSADYRHYDRPPDRYYRERDDHYPPRSRYPPESYSSRPVDGYRAHRPSADSYVSSYDRREEDRYREYWEVRDAREREWREYSHETRHGHSERSERERDQGRARRPERREYSPLRHREWKEDDRRRERVREPEPERAWTSRTSRSPPRRIVTGRPRRSRSPTPTRARSPRSSYRRSYTPVRRQRSRPSTPNDTHRRRRSRTKSPPGGARVGKPSVPASPRSAGPVGSPRDLSPRPRSPISDHRKEKVARSPSNPPDVLESDPSRNRSLPIIVTEDAKSLPPRLSPAPRNSPNNELTLSAKPEVKVEDTGEPISPAHLSRADKGKMREVDMKIEVSQFSQSLQPTQDTIQPPLPHKKSRTPPIAPRRYIPTPPIPSSPKTPQPGAVQPTRAERPRWIPSAPESQQVSNDESIITTHMIYTPDGPRQFVLNIKKYDHRRWPHRMDLAALTTELDQLRRNRMHLATNYQNLQKTARRALHELDMSTIELNAATARRIMSGEQLEKARGGQLGIDYVRATPAHDGEPNSIAAERNAS